MDEFEFQKLQKLFNEFEANPNAEIAADIELRCDMMKLQLGDRFYDLRHFLRISNAVSNYLDKLNADEEEECCKCADFDNPTVDKIGIKLGII